MLLTLMHDPRPVSHDTPEKRLLHLGAKPQKRQKKLLPLVKLQIRHKIIS